MTSAVVVQTAEQLLGSYTRELMLIAGKDGTGKSSAIVSLAAFVQMMQPEAEFNVIDSEHKFGSALKSFGTDAPHNIRYYAVNDMNQATTAISDILKRHKPGDWLAVESMARIWDHAQNLTYLAVAGVSKIEYLEMKINAKTPTGVIRKDSPIPNPNEFWQICNGAHNGAFIDLITRTRDLNCILTTTCKRPPEDRGSGRSFDNKDRKIFRAEVGIDLNLGGAPSLPFYFETMCLLELEGGKVRCRVLRDNNSQKEDTRPTFDVADRKAWAMSFWGACR